MAAPQPAQGYTNNTPLTVADFIERGLSTEDAIHRVNQMVFGHDYKAGADGKPIEQGLGSAAQPTPQHFAALAKEAERAAMAGSGLTPDAIASAAAKLAVTPEAFAAAVKAVIDNRPPRRKPGRKPKLVQPQPPEAA